MGYSIKQKIDICLMAESKPEMTQQDLAHWAKTRYGSSKPPSQTTISRILAKKDEFIALKEHEFKLIRRRRLSNPLLRKVLLEWIAQSVWNNIPISAPIILSSAGNLWKQIPEHLREGTGEFSYRWCSQFLSKVDIQLNNVENELYNRLKVWSIDERDDVKELLSSFDPRKIFTLSELFISHDLPLDKSYYADNSDFLTCMLCVNIDGTEKFDPLIIGRYENYPSFEGKSSARISAAHGVTYHSNMQKWLTSTMFYDWLSVVDKRLALTNRDIVLILDDSASHRVINIKLERIRLLYTSSNPSFSPMNWGIENDFRLNFRINQYRRLVKAQTDQGMTILSREQQSFSIIETFDLIKMAWASVPESRIQSAWKKSGILPDSISKHFVKQRLFDDRLESELLHLIEEFQVMEKWDVLTLLDLTVEQKINKTFLSTSEIVKSCIVENYDDVNHNTGDRARAPFSHDLGKPLARLQRLGERLNSNTGSDLQMMDFDSLDFNADGDFDMSDASLQYLDRQLTSPPALAYPNCIPNTRDASKNLPLQPMSELTTNSRPRNFDPNFVKEEFLEMELPWTDLFESEINTPGGSTVSSVANNFDINQLGDINTLMSSNQNMATGSQNSALPFQQADNINGTNHNFNERLSVTTAFLNMVDRDNSINLTASTMAELRSLQVYLIQNPSSGM